MEIEMEMEIEDVPKSKRMRIEDLLEDLSDKTKQALQKAIDEQDHKTEKWIRTSILKGYEGVGVIPYTRDGYNNILFILGINSKNEAEYPGGKCEEQDEDIVSTAVREFMEETGIILEKKRFTKKMQINGGTTGYPSYVFLVEINPVEVSAILVSPSNSIIIKDSTFSHFIMTENIIDCEKVTDRWSEGEYELRKFNKKYIIPQVKDMILDLEKEV